MKIQAYWIQVMLLISSSISKIHTKKLKKIFLSCLAKWLNSRHSKKFMKRSWKWLTDSALWAISMSYTRKSGSLNRTARSSKSYFLFKKSLASNHRKWNSRIRLGWYLRISRIASLFRRSSRYLILHRSRVYWYEYLLWWVFLNRLRERFLGFVLSNCLATIQCILKTLRKL